jgi:hypothetical protein
MQRLKPEYSEYYEQAHTITGLFPSGYSAARLASRVTPAPALVNECGTECS